jgi:hypothetical protein
MRWIVLACLLWGGLGSAKAWGAERAWALPALAEQAALRDATLAKRLTEILPGLMRREGVDLWLLAAREYNDDPVLKTFLPATWPTARRRTLLLIHDRGPERGLETLALAR